jgi:predicted site-specific integrase-resolvase
LIASLRICPKKDAVAMERHLNQRDLARRWAMSARTLERWRWTGEGPPFLKVGGRVVYRLTDIEAYEVERLRRRTAITSAASGRCR